VRLDHLLSKEQLSPKGDSSPRPANVRSGCSQAETLASQVRQRPASQVQLLRRRGTWAGAAGILATKKAPCWVSEGTTRVGRLSAGAREGGCFSMPGMTWFPIPAAVAVLVGDRLRVVGWSLVENCTVDASILFSVVKLSRANGGCLGTRSR
jgi:hypothetical protein